MVDRARSYRNGPVLAVLFTYLATALAGTVVAREPHEIDGTALGVWSSELLYDSTNWPHSKRDVRIVGTLLVGARGLAGQNPNAQDNINASWWQLLLVEVASGKTVDSSKPFRSRGIGQLEHTEHLGSITLRYSDYLKPYAQSLADIYLRCRSVIEKRMGVVAQDFQAKRRLATPDEIKRYDENVTVVHLSIAMKRDLFPWFKEYGIEVDSDKSPICWQDTHVGEQTLCE